MDNKTKLLNIYY